MNNIPIDPEQPFVAGLRKNLEYHTPVPPRRVFLAPVRYLKGILGIVADCSWVARHYKFDNQDVFNTSYNTIKLVERVGGTVEIKGLEHLASQPGPAVVVANHMSLLDAFMLPCLIIAFRPMCVVIKKELTEYPGFGRTMSTLNHIAVTRENPRADFRAVMEEGATFLNNGISMLIFPQSTRNAVFVPSEFNTLGEKLAAKAGVPVIPVAVKTDLHGNGRLFKEFGRIDPSLPVRVRFGPAIDPRKEGRNTHETVIRFISTQLREWGMPVQEPVSADTPTP